MTNSLFVRNWLRSDRPRRQRRRRWGPHFLQLEAPEQRVLPDASVGIANVALLDPKLGPTVSGTLTASHEANLYRFDGLQGQRLQFDWKSAASAGQWSVLGPDNVVPAQADLGTSLQVTLPADSGYTLALDNQTFQDVAYTFTAQEVSDPATAVSGFDQAQAGTLAPGASQQFTYTAPAGRIVLFDDLASGFSPFGASAAQPAFTLSGPGDWQTSFGSLYAGDSRPVLLPAGGTYTLTLTNSSPAAETYNFRLLDLQGPATRALALGATASSSALAANSADVYRFSASPGLLLFDDQNSFGAQVTLYDPALRAVPEAPVAAGSSGYYPASDRLDNLAEGGTYYAVVSNNYPTAANYAFRLVGGGGAAAADVPGALQGTLTPGSGAALYTFQGARGQHVFLATDPDPSTVAVPFSVFDPAARLIGSAPAYAAYLDLALPADGTYTVLVAGQSADPAATRLTSRCPRRPPRRWRWARRSTATSPTRATWPSTPSAARPGRRSISTASPTTRGRPPTSWPRAASRSSRARTSPPTRPRSCSTRPAPTRCASGPAAAPPGRSAFACSTPARPRTSARCRRPSPAPSPTGKRWPSSASPARPASSSPSRAPRASPTTTRSTTRSTAPTAKSSAPRTHTASPGT
jgi:hypothetical protein